MFFNNYSELSVDSRQVVSAANVLNVTEFRLFELAYREWFGCTGKEVELEKLYALYWFTGLAPDWVRHYSRQVLTLCRQIGHEALVVEGPVGNAIFKSVTLWCLGLSVLLLLAVM